MKITSNQKTPLSGLSVPHETMITLSPEAVDLAFYHRLKDLCEDMFIRDGQLWRFNGDDQMGHEIADTLIGPVEDGPHNLAIAAIRLRRALIEAAV